MTFLLLVSSFWDFTKKWAVFFCAALLLINKVGGYLKGCPPFEWGAGFEGGSPLRDQKQRPPVHTFPVKSDLHGVVTTATCSMPGNGCFQEMNFGVDGHGSYHDVIALPVPCSVSHCDIAEEGWTQTKCTLLTCLIPRLPG